MEPINEVDNKNRKNLVTFIIVILLILAICYQVKIVREVVRHGENLNANPLTYGAKKYNIESCFCITKDFNMNINFNQTTIRTIKSNPLPTDFKDFGVINNGSS